MIAVVITTYNHARFLEEAIQSCLRQSRPMDEIIVVDDGSTDNPASIVERHPGVRLIRQDNCGLAAARNTGLAASRSDYITFLDADDRLLPNAIEAGVRMLVAHPDAVLAYGAHRFINGSGAIESDNHHVGLIEDPYLQLLRTGNFIAMHATVVYRRERLAAMGGFDVSMRFCEDYELFLRIARRGSIVTHGNVVAEYRMHGDNMSNNRTMMLAAALSVLDKQLAGPVDDDVRLAVRDGRRFWKTYYTGELTTEALRTIRAEPAKAIRMLRRALQMSPPIMLQTAAFRIKRKVGRHVQRLLGVSGADWRAPLVGSVRFGDFARTMPISRSFGYDRGKPIDRYYIENFLQLNAADIHGRVLEIGDNSYTMHFGGAHVVKSDVLHVDSDNPNATIVGDLSQPGVLPSNAFDCIILTQTLHLIFDMSAAVAALAEALKPGGVLLLTVPGITPVDRGEWGSTWFWSLTQAALAKLLAESFSTANMALETHGNVFAAVCFLQGLAKEEVSDQKLDVRDTAYPVVVTARVVKDGLTADRSGSRTANVTA